MSYQRGEEGLSVQAIQQRAIIPPTPGVQEGLTQCSLIILTKKPHRLFKLCPVCPRG